MVGQRLYERAATEASEPPPLWRLDDGRALFIGPLHHNAPHQHSIPVYLAGLYGTFRLRIGEGGWLSCRTAVIPAGVPYEFDVGGSPLAVFYLEPSIAGVDALTPLLRNTREVNQALIGSAGEITLMRELYEDPSSARWIGLAMDDLLAFSRARAGRLIDDRISRALRTMGKCPDDLMPIVQVASSVGLSESRFQHVFTREVGVPFRRYRAWCRLRAAISEIVQGSNFTTAAHLAGFCDQAHFAHDFRRTFGAPASSSLSRVRK